MASYSRGIDFPAICVSTWTHNAHPPTPKTTRMARDGVARTWLFLKRHPGSSPLATSVQNSPFLLRKVCLMFALSTVLSKCEVFKRRHSSASGRLNVLAFYSVCSGFAINAYKRARKLVLSVYSFLFPPLLDPPSSDRLRRVLYPWPQVLSERSVRKIVVGFRY